MFRKRKGDVILIAKVYADPDIYRIYIPLPDNPLKNLNCYVVCSEGEYLVIDTGFNRPECLQALEMGLDEIGVVFSRCKLFLTHLHSDHSGLAYYFYEKNVPIYMNPVDHEHLIQNLTTDNLEKLDRQFADNGYPVCDVQRQNEDNQGRLYCTPVLFPAIHVTDGDVIQVGRFTFECIHTPGHSPGHTCLYLPEEEILFSGDHILFDITPNISMHVGIEDPLGDYLKSLEKISKYRVKYTFPGHREFNGNFQDRIEELLVHHEKRLEELRQAIKEYGPCSAYELAGHISWSSRSKRWEDFSNNQRWFAMGETMTHLILLGKKERNTRD